MTAIIILNWNGYEDTIECLESLFSIQNQNFIWLVADNGSDNDSVEKIAEYLRTRQKNFLSVREDEPVSYNLQPGEGVLYALKDNYGFAQGNNLGVALVEALTREGEKPDHYLLLNNDTLVEPDFLEKLETFSSQNPQYVAMTPQIRRAGKRHLIWNCGGSLVFGLRIYRYENKPYSEIKEKHFMPISLITGCALFVKRELIGFPDAWLQKKSKRYASRPHSRTEATDILSNRFFFGEEDFDFSLRLQDQKKKMACVLDSVIYHKAGESRKQFLPAGHLYMHHLNRFVDVRQHWRPFKFFIWKLIYMPYISLALLLRDKIRIKEILRYQKNLWKESAELDGMDKALFLKWIFSK